MSAERGYVTGLNRVAGTVTVHVLGGADVEAVVLNEIPPPRAACWVEQVNPGQWILLGHEAAGVQRRLFHEDYLGGGIKPAAIAFDLPVLHDLNWSYLDGAANSTVGVDNTAGTGDPLRMGQAIMTTGGAAIGQYVTEHKSILNADGVTPSGSINLWAQICCGLPLVTSEAVQVGLADTNITGKFLPAAAGASAIEAYYDTSVGGNWLLRTRQDAVEQVTDTLIPAVAGRFYQFDLLWLPGSQAALYIDGFLRAISIVGIPPIGVGMTAVAGIYNRVAAQRSLIMDRYTVDVVGTLQPFT